MRCQQCNIDTHIQPIYNPILSMRIHSTNILPSSVRSDSVIDSSINETSTISWCPQCINLESSHFIYTRIRFIQASAILILHIFIKARSNDSMQIQLLIYLGIHNMLYTYQLISSLNSTSHRNEMSCYCPTYSSEMLQAIGLDTFEIPPGNQSERKFFLVYHLVF